MKLINCLIIFITIISFPYLKTNVFYQQTDQGTDIQKVTLYIRHNPKDKDYGKASFSFRYGIRSEVGKEITKSDWDIKYGYALIDGNSDYFGVTLISNDRSRIKDLGKLNWSDLKQVPVLLANPGPYKGVRFPFIGESMEVTSEGQVTKVVERHMYVAHIKDDSKDFYVLMRVEELVSNDKCTISWKIVPSPEEKK